jgi:hypothetical protein
MILAKERGSILYCTPSWEKPVRWAMGWGVGKLVDEEEVWTQTDTDVQKALERERERELSLRPFIFFVFLGLSGCKHQRLYGSCCCCCCFAGLR